MKKADITTEVWRKLFPLKVGDKVRFLGLSRRWEVGHIRTIYGEPIGECRFVIGTGKGKKTFHAHLGLKIGSEIKLWRKRR